MDIIEKSRSPYSIPVVPVFKKNGDVKLCLDARKINELIIPDRKRPLTIDNILAKFEKVKVYQYPRSLLRVLAGLT